MNNVDQTQEFVPIAFPSREELITPLGNRIELSFSHRAQIQIVDFDQLRSATCELYKVGYDYLFGTLGRDSSYLSKAVDVEFSNACRFGHQGTSSRVPIKLIRELIEDPYDQERRDIVQSQIIHEIMHNLTDDEDLPMFAEMIYLLENKRFNRIDYLDDNFRNSTLDKPYMEGLKKISEWIGVDEPSKLMSVVKKSDLSALKRHFLDQVNGYCSTKLSLEQIGRV